MNAELGLGGVEDDAFTAKPKADDEHLETVLTGTADLKVQDQLAEHLGQLHEVARRMQVDEVVVDMRDLEFMNSSCFKCFVSWIAAIQDMPTDSQYRLRFLASASTHWQRRSLHALRCFAVDLIDVVAS